MKDRELEVEIFSLLDGELDAGRVAALEKLLLSDPDALETYRSCAYFHSALSTRLRGGDRVESWNVIPHDKIVAMQRVRAVKFSIAAAVAVLLAIGSLLWMRMSQNHAPERFAFAVTPGSQFTVTHTDGPGGDAPGELLPGSRMRMIEGNLECMLKDGVKMLAEAPFDLTVLSGGKLRLDEGSAWFHVPEKARGFRVVTRELEVIDLGTEFGIESSPDVDDVVHVFTGRVNAKSLNPRGESQVLAAGQAVSTDAAGRLHARAVDRSRFLERLPEKLKELAIYQIQSRWIGERFLSVDGDLLVTGAVNGENGHWVFQRSGSAYLIRNPVLQIYLRLADDSDAVIPVKTPPADDRGRWWIEATAEGVTMENKATGRYLNIEDLGKPPAANLDRPPSLNRWTSGLWNLIHVGGGEAEDFGTR